MPADALVQAARRLRRDGTSAERALWAAVRNRGIVGAKMRRQASPGSFVVDFMCPEARLVIEIDGGQHCGSAADASRDALLTAQGWMVLRHWNHEVAENLDGVLADIAGRIEMRRAAHPLTPTLSPSGERGGKRRRLRPPDGAAVPSPPGGEGQGEVAPSARASARPEHRP